MPIAMVRHDSMALDELKEMSLSKSSNLTLKWDAWECRKSELWASSPTDLCESSSDHYSSDGCADDEVELCSVIWTSRTDGSFLEEDPEGTEDPQIISPYIDSETSIVINPNICIITNTTKMPRQDNIHCLTRNEMKSDEPTLQESVPRAVHGGKSKKILPALLTNYSAS